MTFLLYFSALTLVLYLIAAVDLLRGNRTVQALRDWAPLTGSNLPRVSIIVPARNEQRNIRQALQSLLALDYPDYELIVVDDRSDDRTGVILDELAARSPRLKVIHVQQLPHGWLGKNHALWVGSGTATGDLFLFTDADIVMEPTILSRAVAFLEKNCLHHLAATPSIHMPTTFLAMFGTTFIIFFSLFTRPWKARDAKSPCHIGIGAFNLLKADAYRKIGGHETIRLRPDDDIKLGKIMKRSGFRQDIVFAPEFLTVEWYSSVREVIVGLEKNAFSGADYNIPVVLAGTTLLAACTVWPFLAIFITHGAVRWAYLFILFLTGLSFVDTARLHHAKAWHVIGYPLTTALFIFILLRTMLLNLSQGGIYWRGTFYPLEELKANKL